MACWARSIVQNEGMNRLGQRALLLCGSICHRITISIRRTNEIGAVVSLRERATQCRVREVLVLGRQAAAVLGQVAATTRLVISGAAAAGARGGYVRMSVA
eukprot:1829365-Prymnesium_polylepis.1